MSLFKTDPLLAFCRLVAWFILVSVIGGALFTLCAGIVSLVNGAFVLGVLRSAYPKLQEGGLILVFFLAMAFIAVALMVMARFMFYLIDIINSVARGEAFTLLNALRIKAMAWISLIGMPLGFFIGGALGAVVERLGPRNPEANIQIGNFDGGFGSSQILMTLLLFVLARLFAQAAAMRDEIEGTV